ncbi:hypothetical protein BC835DRAFT_700153 [Cytidiella melzeri]|nr:hypothetical protein BC835DRAFT_700153 [Cytidiella melzeri]
MSSRDRASLVAASGFAGLYKSFVLRAKVSLQHVPNRVFRLYSSARFNTANRMECPICWETLHTKHVTSVPCGHLFHEQCLLLHIQQRAREADEDEENIMPDCPTCRTPIKRLNKNIMKRIPVSLHEYVQGALRRVYLSPPSSDEVEHIREMDHLWSRLEQMQHSLEESGEKVVAAENKVATLTEALKKERQRNKGFQTAITLLQQQRMKVASARARDGRQSTSAAGQSGTATTKLDDEEMRRLVVQVRLPHILVATTSQKL